MPNLREIADSTIRPTVDSSAGAYAGYAQDVTSSVAGAAQAYNSRQYQEQQLATQQRKVADAAALGGLVGEAVGEQASFLVDSVENEMAKAAGKRAEDEGVQVGSTGTEVLTGAARLSKVEGYLRESGQLNTLNQIRLLTKQQQLVARRPDLAEDVIRITNAASTDANAILKKDEEDAVALQAKRRAAEEEHYDTVLKANNAFDPKAGLAEKRKLALVYQHSDAGRQLAAQQLLALEQDDKVAQLRDNGDQRASDRRARSVKQSSTDVVEGSYIPNTIISMADRARVIAASGKPGEQRLLDWQEFQAGVEADTVAAIKDPQLRASTLETLRSRANVYNDYVSGKTRTEAAVAEQHGIEANAMLDVYNAGGPQATQMLQIVRDIGPVLTSLTGKSGATQSLSNTFSALITSMGLDVQQTQIAGITSPADARKAGRAGLPNVGATSPYTLPNQQPKDVTDKQVAQATSDLVAVVTSIGKFDSSTPSHKRMAAKAVVSGFTDPVVAQDGRNVKAMIYGLAGDPSIAKAFQDNPAAGEAQAAFLQQSSAYFASVKLDVQRQMGVNLDDLVVGGVRKDGTVVFTPKPGSTIFPSMVSQLNADANASVRAWAHLNGTSVTADLAVQYLKGR